MRNVASAFYAGETGLRDLLDDWDAATLNDLGPGDSLLFPEQALEGNATYVAKIVRTDDGSHDGKRYFYVEASGRPADARQAHRRQAAMLTVRFHDLCCDAALETVDSVRLTGPATVSGNSQDPIVWIGAGACTGVDPASAPGIRTPDATTVDKSPPGRIEGSPSGIEEEPTMTGADLLQFDDVDYAALLEYADHSFADGTDISSVAPTLAGGACDRSDPLNWGAPDDPAHPCFNHFPVFHGLGDLTVRGDYSGQGVLLVDGDLIISNRFRFYGILIVRGNLEIRPQSEVYGGARVLGETGGETRVFAQAELRRSPCAIERAERLSRLAWGRPLQARAWIDLL